MEEAPVWSFKTEEVQYGDEAPEFPLWEISETEDGTDEEDPWKN